MTRRSRRGLRRLAIAALAAVAAFPAAGGRPVAAAQPHDLFISEYLEGVVGFDKAIEIFNGTGAPIDLAAGTYLLEVFANGSTTPQAMALSGVIDPGEAFVVAHPSANFDILTIADQTSAALSFNGNDAVQLRRSTAGIPSDRIGQIGVDPGVLGWGAGEVTTANHDLRRDPWVITGRTTNDAFDPAAEWGSLPGDSAFFNDLGFHTIDSEGPAGAAGIVDAVVTVPTSAACLELTTTVIGFGLVALGAVDAPASPTIGVTNCSAVAGTIYARGTDATGPSAAWDLVDSPATCADTLGVDAYRLRLADTATVELSTENKSLGTFGAGATTNQTARMDTACAGSTGGGTTMTFEILFLATEG